MTPVEPQRYGGAQLVIFAKDQPEYVPLPAMVSADGVVMTEWEPTADELERLLQGGRLRLWVHTFGHPLQPVALEVVEPECGVRGE